jgi:L-2,4-diaminobutyrate decarboxylase
VHRPESNILCFRYVGLGHGDSHGNGQGAGADALDDAALDGINRELRERYNASGEGWITTTVLNGRRVLRVTVMNPATTEAHLDRLLEGLDRAAG